MKPYGESEGVVPLILHLSARCRWVVNFRTPSDLLPGKNPGIHWADLRAGLDSFGCPCLGSSLRL